MVRARLLISAAAVAVVAASTGAAAGPPPPPTAAGGQAVAVLARGVPTPTAFAFGHGQVFVAAFGDEQNPKIQGGVFTVKDGSAVRVPGSPRLAWGLAFDRGTLYLSTGFGPTARILAWSGWNGTRFRKQRVVARGPKGFSGFNGIALGPDGRLYTGVSLGDAKTADYEHGRTPYANSFLAVDPKTGKLDLIATGMRQPWQAIFVPGLRGPLVSDLSQENLGKKRPPDRLLVVEPGLDFGFPDCPARPKTCSQYAKPFARFPAHASPVGLGYIGKRLYVALFSGTGKGPVVISMPTTGGTYKPFLTGFVAPVVAVGAHNGQLYVGDLTGAVYRVKP
jgi:glucose/arabinose dehydrogenase